MRFELRRNDDRCFTASKWARRSTTIVALGEVLSIRLLSLGGRLSALATYRRDVDQLRWIGFGITSDSRRMVSVFRLRKRVGRIIVTLESREVIVSRAGDYQGVVCIHMHLSLAHVEARHRLWGWRIVESCVLALVALVDVSVGAISGDLDARCDATRALLLTTAHRTGIRDRGGQHCNRHSHQYLFAPKHLATH